MPHQLFVTDRATIEQGFLVRSAYALISIRDPDAKRARVPKCSALKATLHLAFSDAEPSRTLQFPPEIRLMTPRQATQILRFVDEHKADVGAFVVHCHQGMSRSPAVAAALAQYLGVDDRPFWKEFTPNLYVYELIRKAMRTQAKCKNIATDEEDSHR